MAKKEQLSLIIGSTVWQFNENRRVYPQRKPGEAYSSGGPIWREHWMPLVVVGETSRSWVIDKWAKIKIPKSGPMPFGWATSQEEIDNLEWGHNNAYAISERVRHADYATLRAVADLVGYEEPKKS